MRRIDRRLALFAAFAAIFLMGKGFSRAEEATDPLLDPIQCVAVMPFENRTALPNAGLVAADLTAVEMYRSRIFRVMDRSEAQSRLGPALARRSGQSEVAYARAVGERLGVDGVIIGTISLFSYAKRGERANTAASARLIDVRSGNTLWRSSVSKKESNEALAGVAQSAIRQMTDSLFELFGERNVELLKICGEEVERLRGSVSGRILDKTSGVPIPGAKLLINAPEEIRIEVDSETGAFETPLLRAEGNEISADAEGYNPGRVIVNVESGQIVPIDILLEPSVVKREPSGILVTRVSDNLGRPVGASLYFEPDLGRPVDTEPTNGTVILQLKPGGYNVTIGAEGHKTKKKDFTINDRQTTSMKVSLVPGPKTSTTPAPKKTPLAVVREKKIEINQKIRFETGSDALVGGSLPILDAVSVIMRDNQEIAKIRIEGHTDSRGEADFNKRLSEDRAESVANYLLKSGVDAGRLETVGHGEEVPVADNSNPQGRAKNRRVDFVILERVSKATSPPAGK